MALIQAVCNEDSAAALLFIGSPVSIENDFIRRSSDAELWYFFI